MSNRFKTYKDEMADVLKYQLMNRSQRAKKYYKDGQYQPETQQQKTILSQSDFYDKITQIGYRVGSDQYGPDEFDVDATGKVRFFDAKPERKLYRDETDRLVKELLENIKI